MSVSEEIIIMVGAQGAIKAISQGGTQKNGELALDPLRKETIMVFNDWLLNNRIENRNHLRVLGMHLYDALFNRNKSSDIAELLKKKLDEVKKQPNNRLRLMLMFEEDSAKLINLPWEFLYSSERDDFLATDADLVLTRFVKPDEDREHLAPEEGPLKILVMISRPKDEDTIRTKDVVEYIKKLEANLSIEVQVVDQPSLESLEEKLGKYKPHVFHFIGHGKYAPKEQAGQLLLVDPESKKARPCYDFMLVQSFKEKEAYPRLVFLHMCEGGVVEGDDTMAQAFSGFAPRLIHARIPAVVAMQYPITNGNAIDFCLAFYETLAEGGSVDEAVQKGRSKLDRSQQTRVFGTPVIFMQSKDAIIILPSQHPGLKRLGGFDKSFNEEQPHKQEMPTYSTNDQWERQSPFPSQSTEQRQTADIIIKKQIFDAGLNGIKSLLDENLKLQVRFRIDEIQEGAEGKTVREIIKEIMKEEENDQNDQSKEVWKSMITAYRKIGAIY